MTKLRGYYNGSLRLRTKQSKQLNFLVGTWGHIAATPLLPGTGDSEKS